MGFISSIFTAVITIVVAVIIFIVDAVVAIVEAIVQLIMILLGWEPEGQTVEYFEVRNIPLFEDTDRQNPLLSAILSSILNNTDLSTGIVYSQTFTSLKGDFRDFMAFIDDGDYLESFPTVESFILIPDYDEVNAALLTLTGVTCTAESIRLNALTFIDWIKYWLQENKDYDVGENRLGLEFTEDFTAPATPAATTNTFLHTLTITDEVATEDTMQVNAETPVSTSPITPAATVVVKTIALTTADEAATEDEMTVESRWQVDFSEITYNSGPDDYTIDVFNDDGDTATLGYTAPAIPTQLHYIVLYYKNSDPTRQYIFIYQVGEGTYVDLDTVETPIDIAGNTLQTVPAIPLRISNSNYTTFGASKEAAIDDICDLVNLDAEAILDEVLNDPDADPGDIDNVYINFGIRLRDTSQVGITYLFNMFENLFPSQGTTQADYDAASPGDDKPQNNIITETDDNKLVFQWSYITFEHTTLAAIDAAPGSDEYAVYYSDASKFNASNLLVSPYYISSAKTTYNVGFKAGTLTEVADFLTGSGTVNSGTVSAEATNWLQVTERLSYNNPTPVLKDPDNTTSALLFLTPDQVYENNGSGVLRLVNSAAEETTVGQAITYYCADEDGLDAYTVVAPIAAMRVIDGDSGVFRTVKFNLGDELDLMAPMIHTFVKDLPNFAVTEVFLDGAHVSIYIAHYEVIQPASMSFLTALVLLIIIIVIIYFAWAAAPELIAGIQGTFSALVAGQVTLLQVLQAAIVPLLKKLLINFAVQLIITEVAKENEELALILSVAAIWYFAEGSGVEGQFTNIDFAGYALDVLNSYNTVQEVAIQEDYQKLEEEINEHEKWFRDQLDALAAIDESIAVGYERIKRPEQTGSLNLFASRLQHSGRYMSSEAYIDLATSYNTLDPLMYDYDKKMLTQITNIAPI